jgi:hypothetical protein
MRRDEVMEEKNVLKSEKIVLDSDAIYCLVKNLREYRRLARENSNNAFFLLKLKLEEDFFNSLLHHGSDFVFLELDKVKELKAQFELRQETIEYLRETEEDIEDGLHDSSDTKFGNNDGDDEK